MRRYELSGRLSLEATDIADAWVKVAEHFASIARGEQGTLPHQVGVNEVHLRTVTHSQQFAFRFPQESGDDVPTRPDHKVIPREESEDKEK